MLWQSIPLQPTKGTPPLRAYLNNFRNQKLEERVS